MRRLLLVVLTCLAVAAPASAVPADTVGRDDLLGVDQVATIYTEVQDEGTRSVFRYGVEVPKLPSPLRCDRTRYERGVSTVGGSFYGASGPTTFVDETLVVMRSGAEAKALVQQFRSFARLCRGSRPINIGEFGPAQQRVRPWRPRAVGDERAGVLEGIVQEGRATWLRTLVTRVGRTVVVAQAEVRGALPDADQLTDFARLAVEELR